ncbi:L,D-transpeptidase family protein [Mucilaginibacter sp. NFX135]|uniref:L,D-transpeptidase family protein n=1 Tax=Mucilaginibacter sp. NFX135 TaxID=3402687 RepID=UPI003AFA4429
MKTRSLQYLLSFGVVILSVCNLQNCNAQTRFVQKTGALAPDTGLSPEIRKQVGGGRLDVQLYYPKSVQRFYQQNRFKPAWIKPQSGTGPAWQTMLMLDCVLQFGLSHADYHPQELQYSRLHDILDIPGKVKPDLQARFDIMLTDAAITFMNYLHYGKLNPEFSASRIDKGIDMEFEAVSYLSTVLKGKDVMAAMANVQPKAKEYKAMQYQMHLMEGLYQGDCYEIPQEKVRKVAINMERLRWANTGDSVYVQINIPSCSLKLSFPDSTYQFKVIVGKPENPTPTLLSKITYFTTAPEWKIPARIFKYEVLPKALADNVYLENSHFAIYDQKGNYVEPLKANLANVKRNPDSYYARQSAGCDNALGLLVFRFPNIYDIYLHDTPEQSLFKKAERALSHGCIRVEQAERLATLLLKHDGSAAKITALHNGMTKYIRQDIYLKKPVAIKITYLTCEIKEGEYITYNDIYNLDQSLEMALYGVDQPLSMR